MRHRLSAVTLPLILTAVCLELPSRAAATRPTEGVTLLFDIDPSVHPGGPATQKLADSAARCVENRLDPDKKKHFKIRAISPQRLEVWMPYPDNCQQANAELQKAEFAIHAASLSRAKIASAIKETGENRIKATDALVPVADPRNALVKSLAAAVDRLDAADKQLAAAPQTNDTESLQQRSTAQREAWDAVAECKKVCEQLDATRVDVDHLRSLLIAAEDPKETHAIRAVREFPALYPALKADLERFIAAHQKLKTIRPAGALDPDDVKRLVIARGRLDFRIAVEPKDFLAESGVRIDAVRIEFLRTGPTHSLKVEGLPARWFRTNPDRHHFFVNGYVTARWDDGTYILCYDDPARAMVHDPAWKVSAWEPYVDERTGNWLLPFGLDKAGANRMGDITGANMKRALAILLDDVALSAPIIQTRITNAAVISFGGGNVNTQKIEAESLQHLLDAGDLPVILKPTVP
jgi:hypothetical protein